MRASCDAEAPLRMHALWLLFARESCKLEVAFTTGWMVSSSVFSESEEEASFRDGLQSGAKHKRELTASLCHRVPRRLSQDSESLLGEMLISET